MKTTVLQSLFKIALLLTCMAIGFGCDDSDEWETEGMDVTCQLAKTVENGTEIEYPAGIAPSLTLKKDLTFEGNAACNSIRGGYKYNADNGRFTIEDSIHISRLHSLDSGRQHINTCRRHRLNCNTAQAIRISRQVSYLRR